MMTDVVLQELLEVTKLGAETAACVQELTRALLATVTELKDLQRRVSVLEARRDR
jgi:hypothetical protein